MTLQQTPTRHDQSSEHTIAFNGILGVYGTCGMKSASRPKQWREAGSIDHQQHNAQASQSKGSPTRANRCRCNVPRHAFCNSTNGRFRHSRFGKTRKACPGTSNGRIERPNSRNRRFARFRCTAVPNRRPITIPIIVSRDRVGQIWRLNNPVETRRPVSLMRWISRLHFKKNCTDRCPAVMTNLLVGSSPDHAQQPEGARRACARPFLYYDQTGTKVPTPGLPSATRMLPTCRLPNGRKVSDGETSAAFGSATSNNFSTILGAHALPKSMFPLALEIRGLFKSERHCALLLERSFFNEEAAL
jgi:hypothetical protein